MKRDIDLARALLFDIESEGADCPINRLRATLPVDAGVTETVAGETPDRVRYHLRLLIDSGLVKEVDRTSAGVPCVRLTNAGHELLELSRSDARWREAKQYTRDSTGGYSLTVVRAVLTKWAVEGVSTTSRGYYRGYRRAYRPYYHRVAPPRRYDGYRYDYRDAIAEEEDLRLVRTRPDYRERVEAREPLNGNGRYGGRDASYEVWDGVDRDYSGPVDRYDYPAEVDGVGVSLPIYLV
ncbi:MAG: DUF2513 domain-containing protein [Planctomycetota bacterium]